MMPRKLVILLFLLVFPLASALSAESHMSDRIAWCEIAVPHDLRDAQFTAVFLFETTKSGKPTNIRKVGNPFLGDEPFVACISGWSLPSASGTVTADFSWKWYWREIDVSAKGFSVSLPYQPAAPTGKLVQKKP
jgi:hypothetical protein